MAANRQASTTESKAPTNADSLWCKTKHNCNLLSSSRPPFPLGGKSILMCKQLLRYFRTLSSRMNPDVQRLHFRGLRCWSSSCPSVLHIMTYSTTNQTVKMAISYSTYSNAFKCVLPNVAYERKREKKKKHSETFVDGVLTVNSQYCTHVYLENIFRSTVV